MSSPKKKSGVIHNEYLTPTSSNSMILEEMEIHQRRSKIKQGVHNVPPIPPIPSSTRGSSSDNDDSDDRDDSENGEDFYGDGNKRPGGMGGPCGMGGLGGMGGTGTIGPGWSGGSGGNNCCGNGMPTNCRTYVILDNDPRVHYTGPWTLEASQSSTTHSTVVEGSTASLRFNGSAVLVFGTIPASNQSEPPTVAYSLDGDNPSITTLPCATTDVPFQPLYTSPQLSSNGEHLLFINVTKAKVPYALSGFSISALVSQPNSTSSQPSQNPSSPTAPLSASFMNTVAPDHRVVSIVAGVLGSLVFLFIVGVIIYFILRWRSHKRRELSEGSSSQGSKSRETVYTAFTTTESILRNDPSIWNRTPSHISDGSSQGSRPSYFLRPSDDGLWPNNDLSPNDGLWPSDFARLKEARLSAIEFAPPSPSKSLSPSTSLEKLS